MTYLANLANYKATNNVSFKLQKLQNNTLQRYEMSQKGLTANPDQGHG